MTSTESYDWPNRPLLIVDDDIAWTNVLTQSLRALGWQDIRSLSDPAHAVALAREFKPAVVLLDLVMAERNGLQVLDDFHEQLPDLPVIVITGINNVQQTVVCMRHGAIDYLTKPLQRERLVDSLKRAMQTREEQRPPTQPSDNDFECMLPELETLPHLKTVPDMLIAEALRRSKGVVKDAASMLGISSQAICNRKRRAEEKRMAKSAN